MNNLLNRNTNRCKLIKDVSKEIWYDIVEMHSTGQDSSEIYYTKKLVSKILLHSKTMNYSIWAREPGMEKIWGCDIDIYIERGVDDFILYAFQAKLLKNGQVYTNLDKNTKGLYQYQKLLNYGVNNQCFTYYLFYNGVANYSYTGNNKCGTQFNEDQYGLSYINIDEIISVIENRANWNFHYFHSKHASPLSELVCCRNRKSLKTKSYNFKEIMLRLEDYTLSIEKNNVEDYFERIIRNNTDKDKESTDQKSERIAELVFVIRNTTSTYLKNHS